MSAQRSAVPRAARSTKATGRPAASSSVFGMQASPWHTTSRSIGGASASSAGMRMPRRAAFARRAGTLHVHGHPSTGSASCRARRPSPTARTATRGSSCQRGSTALRASRATVTSHSSAASCPCSTTSGTVIQSRAHRIRSASSRMFASRSSGPHLMYRPSSVRKVSPPMPFSQTGMSAASPARWRTRAGIATPGEGKLMTPCSPTGGGLGAGGAGILRQRYSGLASYPNRSPSFHA